MADNVLSFLDSRQVAPPKFEDTLLDASLEPGSSDAKIPPQAPKRLLRRAQEAPEAPPMIAEP